MATDPARMVALLLGIPGARQLELDDDAQDVDLRLVIEVSDEPSMCVPCGATGTEIGRVIEDLGVTSTGENVIRVHWSRRQFSCPSESCPAPPWLETNGGVDAFVARIAQSRPIRFS